jgi:hypothetical protein
MFANRYYKEFTNYLKGRNRSPEQATFGDLKSFMSKNKIPTHNVPNNPAGAASSDMVNSILTQTAGEYLSGTGAKTSQTNQKQTGATSTPTGSVNNQSSTTTVNTAPTVKVDDLVNQISQLNAKQLSKIEQAVQSAKAAMPSTAKTPGEIRAEKQAKATQAARSQLASTKPVAQQPSPSDVRAQKQSVAATNAQAQMANTPVTPATTPTPRRKSRRRGRKVTAAV